MTSETADSTTPTIKAALDEYIRSLKSNGKPKPKSRGADKPVDPNMLQDFLRYLDSQNTQSMGKLIRKEVIAYSDKVNNDRDKNSTSKNSSPGGVNTNAVDRLQAVKGFLSYANKREWTDENLARHIRIRKPRGRAGSIIQRGRESIDLTSQGHRELESERERLLAETQTLLDDIHRARADGDVTENSPLDAAREEHARKEARIKAINATLERAVVIDAAANGADAQIVKIGANVKVEDLKTKRVAAYTIVNSNEAKPLEKRISDDSPIGRALIGKQIGDEVDIETPGGARRYAIKDIS